MRIAMLISTPFPPEEGIGNHVYNVSKKLIERGYEVTVMTRGSLKTTQIHTLDGIRVIKVPYIPIYPFHVNIHGFFVNRLFKSLENEFDIVHIHTPLTPVIKTDLPILVTFHSPMIIGTKYMELIDLKSWAAKIMAHLVSYTLELKLIKRANIMTAVSNHVAYELERYYNVSHDMIRVIGNGVDEKKFVPSKHRNENYILYVGRLSHGKGLLDLIECARNVCKHYKDVSFYLVGKGDLENMLKEKVKSYGLQGRIFFLGHIKHEKLIQLYQNAILLVIPSYYESGPLVLLEAMSCGIPVVSTPVGIAPEIIKNNENGILIPHKKMAEAISVLIEDGKLRRKLGNNARKTIERKYTWNSVTDRVEECYKSCT